MKAVVLAAGYGRRLDPITRYVAKPAVPLAGQTLIERVLVWLAGEGVTDAVVNLHYRPETITSVLGDGTALGLRIRYSWEPVILGSAGGPKQAMTLWPGLADPCLIVNADTLTTLPLGPLIEAHQASGALATLAVVANPRPDHYNGLRAGADRRVTGFVARGQAEGTWHFVGVQVVNAEVFDSLPGGEPAETVAGLYRDLVRDRPGSVCVWPVDAPFVDVGTPADYRSAALRLAGTGDAVIEAGARVDPAARLVRCVVWDRATVEAGVRLTDCVVLSGAHVPAGTVASDQVIEPRP